ncbi:substrate-binding periplasmic protein [Rugamonas apoptosis]|uniref:Transporter substrate-binding domain-containing protein n=1 Tax=Rugamonas apoptosis TaxID=2758570 RepID=A0A7W2FC05_9BURK|nr:transporter substrate-binding domain-containing protein [Rugamonas apoptosis]MBA5688963.1 transporter substrate-binding domain-containing protein [Rugamonas apoptosis]
MRILQLLPAWLLLCASVSADAQPGSAQVSEVRLLAGAVPYYCQAERDRPPSGLACDVLVEMAHRAGHSGKLEMYPLPRALVIAAATPDVLLAPVARIPAREATYDWQIPILEDELVAVTRQDSTADISSPDKLQQLSVGVVRYSASAITARERGWQHVEMVASEVINARKLRAGHIDVWISAWNAIRAAQQQAGLPLADLRRGAVLGRVQIYLVSSRSMPAARLALWKRAFESMRRDGTYQRILNKYRYETPM